MELIFIGDYETILLYKTIQFFTFALFYEYS